MDTHDVRQAWAERSGEYSPTYYAHYGRDETSERVVETLSSHADPDSRVLEVGCGVGRHLAALREAGFDDLTGIDINADALNVLTETYPELAATGSFHQTTVEAFVDGTVDSAFDVVFSVETLQHIPPAESSVFPALARITDDLLVTVENEGGELGTVEYVDDDLPLYYRDWRRVFTDCGLDAVSTTTGKRDTVRVFRRP